jgi:LysM repeat protein
MSYRPPQPPSLVMRRGPQPNRPFPLDKDVITIGRSPDNDIFVDDAEVSRHHARLTRQGNNWVLEDLGSRNGTFVNGQRISGPVMLTPGAQVDFGPDVSFGVEGGMPPPEAIPARPPAYAPPRPRRSAWLLWTLGGAVVVFALVVAAIAGYFFLRPSAPESIAVLEAPGVTGPDIALQEPASGAEVGLGESVMVFAAARDEKGVTRTELWIDGQFVVQQDSPDPNGVTPLSLVHYWVTATPGTHSLIVQAYNSQGAMGTSPVIYVDVSEEPSREPTTAQYVVQPGDDPQKVAQKTGTTVTVLKRENPTMGQVITPGQTLAVPVSAPPRQPPAQPSQAPAQPPSQPPGKPLAAAGPSAAPLKAPDQLNAALKDCTVTLTWHDNADNEDGFGVLRAVKGTDFKVLQPLVGKSDGTGKTVQFVDKVLGPDTYLYAVVAGTAAGARAQSNPLQVKVPSTLACTQPAGYKRIFFQPRTVQAQGDLALLFGAGVEHFWRIPPDQTTALAPGDWSQFRQPVPVPVYLNPGDPVNLMVAGVGRKGEDLGKFLNSHPQGELSPTKVWKGSGKEFELEYSLWLEDVTWGQGTTKKIPAPGNLRFAKTPEEMNKKIPGCAGGKCDPKAALVWDWAGDPRTIEGYILYRFYSCPGKDVQVVAPKVVDVADQGMAIPSGAVPAGCAARYQVSAFGPAGESDPSQPLDVPATAPAADVSVAFEELKVKGLSQQMDVGRVALQANQYILESEKLVLQDLLMPQQIFLNDRLPNNRLTVGLAEGESLQLGFLVQVGGGSCAGQAVIPPPESGWGKYQGRHVLESKDGNCQMAADVNGEPPVPFDDGRGGGGVDISLKELYQEGDEIYVVLQNDSPFPIPREEFRTKKVCSWEEIGQEGLTFSRPCRGILEAERVDTWYPPDAEKIKYRVDVSYLLNHTPMFDGQKPMNNVLLLEVELVNSTDPTPNDNSASLEIGRPNGADCSNDDQCHSLYCADKKKCAPKNGTGKGGDYCHHADHCAGYCDCEKDASGFCIGWENYSDETHHATCTEQAVNGKPCSEARDCLSGHCANGICAPENGTGQEGDYCHHRDHCASGICDCKLGYDGDFCRNWQNLSEDEFGKCISKYPNGDSCSEDKHCISGHCADGKCAPKNDTGKGGEYCHHDDHCATGYCQCAKGDGGFCQGWRDFTPDKHAICETRFTNGEFCRRDQECDSGHCANGKCAPKDNTGSPGEYCHHSNHCFYGICYCPDGTRAIGNSFCPGWENFTPTLHGVCQTRAKNGDSCGGNKECESGYCADGKCAPKNGTGEGGDYCHHDDHCASKTCICPGLPPYTPRGFGFGGGGFCPGWEKFDSYNHGTCLAKGENGERCLKNEQCKSNYCADGKICAPVDDTGWKGDYCHHNNHCNSAFYCDCPKGNTDFWGFCPGWEDFTLSNHGVCREK